MIGNKGSYLPVFKLLILDKVTINGNKVESTDIISVEEKSLVDMGKASQSEYEAIGFESTDINECYWYFDGNDELELMIK